MAKRNVAVVVGLLALVGCVGGPDATTESQEAGQNVAGKMLFFSPGRIFGWGGGRRVWGDTKVLYQDDYQVTVQSDLVVLSPFARQGGGGGFGGGYGAPRWSVLELKAKQEGLWQRIKTDLGLVVFQRPVGSRQAWRPLVCGDASREDQPQNGIQFFTPDTVINIAAQTIKTEAGLVMFRDCGIGAQRGGAGTPPEFAAFVITRSNWGNMGGEFRYKLEASCDRADCPRDDTNYQAEPVLLDYPGATSWNNAAGNANGGGFANNNAIGRERCDNGVDDDADFLTDCTDPDCAGQWNGRSVCPAGNALNPGGAGVGRGREVCGNFADDDGDRMVDCDDSDCWADRACESGDESCTCWNDEWQSWISCACDSEGAEAAGDDCSCWDDGSEQYVPCPCEGY